MTQGNDNSLPAKNYFLEPGYIYVAAEATVISTVLGTGVAVCIYDRKHRSGGMNRFQYPATRDRSEATATYGNVATLALIRMLTHRGAKPRHLEAQILGGAQRPEEVDKGVGPQNVRVARQVLERHRITVVSEDVGGERGRKVVFNTGTNEVAVIKVERLRQCDWYPYRDGR